MSNLVQDAITAGTPIYPDVAVNSDGTDNNITDSESGMPNVAATMQTGVPASGWPGNGIPIFNNMNRLFRIVTQWIRWIYGQIAGINSILSPIPTFLTSFGATTVVYTGSISTTGTTLISLGSLRYTDIKNMVANAFDVNAQRTYIAPVNNGTDFVYIYAHSGSGHDEIVIETNNASAFCYGTYRITVTF